MKQIRTLPGRTYARPWPSADRRCCTREDALDLHGANELREDIARIPCGNVLKNYLGKNITNGTITETTKNTVVS